MSEFKINGIPYSQYREETEQVLSPWPEEHSMELLGDEEVNAMNLEDLRVYEQHLGVMAVEITKLRNEIVERLYFPHRIEKL